MIVVVDYGVGNLGSIANMLKKVGARAEVSSRLDRIRTAEKLILPGVGAFDEGIARLDRSGIRAVLEEKVLKDRTPILGICLGMQLMTRRSEEGNSAGLGWIRADTRRFQFSGGDGLRIPHMGWNTVSPRSGSAWFAGAGQEPRFYFVHSYHVMCDKPEDVLAVTEYGRQFVSAFECGNILGVQFHPEKSHQFGITLMRNWATA
jgi:imidazole glycerol-phosphate synthase subunit HisH